MLKDVCVTASALPTEGSVYICVCIYIHCFGILVQIVLVVFKSLSFSLRSPIVSSRITFLVTAQVYSLIGGEKLAVELAVGGSRAVKCCSSVVPAQDRQCLGLF